MITIKSKKKVILKRRKKYYTQKKKVLYHQLYLKKLKLLGKKHFGVIFISSTLNNCIATLHNRQEEVISWSSCGSLGFKGANRSSSYAAESVGRDIAKKAKENKIYLVQVFIRGLGSGRQYVIKGLRKDGIHITRLIDITSEPYNGCRSKKKRRL